jgi:hypothetical protein
MKNPLPNHSKEVATSLDLLSIGNLLTLILITLFLYGMARLFDLSLSQPLMTYASLVGIAWILWQRSGVLLLLFVQIYFLLREPMGIPGYDFVSHTAIPVLVVVGIATAYRLDGIRKTRQSRAMDWLWNSIFLLKDTYRSVSAGEYRQFLPFFKQFVLTIAVVFACLSVSALLFSIVGRNDNADSTVGLLTKELQAIRMGMVLMVIFLITLIITGYWRWRLLSGSQARIYLRSYLAAWLEDDQRLIVRKRRQLRRQMTLPPKKSKYRRK